MRAYLLTSIFLACVLPVLDTTVPSTLSAIDTPPDNAYGWNTYDWLNLKSYTKATSENTSAKAINWLLMLPLFLYIGGIVYKSWVLCKELHKISRLISCHPKVKESQYMIVYQAEHLSTFSFLNYIFLGKGVEGLHAWEVAKIKAHEQVHVRQKHSLDLLFFELFSIVFWFNPLVTYLKESLQNVHEFLADEEVSGKGKQQKAYAHLLIKLSGPADSITLATSFTKKQIHNRITMLMKTRTLALKKFYFLLLIPLIASLLFLFSCIDEGHEDLQSVTDAALVEQPNAQASIKDGNKIASIRWEGNSVYSDEQLSEALDLKPGDFYNEELLNSRLYYNPGLDDLSSLYMDHGYLFFNISVKEIKVEPGVNELVFDIYEGEQVKTKNIIIKGNQSVSKEEILSQLVIKSGDWFNRADLIASQKAIAEMGYFDAKNVRINPIPHADEGTVDIEFVLTEINAKN